MKKWITFAIIFTVLVITGWVTVQYEVLEKGFTMEIIWKMVDNALNVIFTMTAIAVVFVVILENRDPVKTTSWLMILILLPILGIILYVFFGRNFRKEKLFSRKELADHQRLNDLSQDQLMELPKEGSLGHHNLRSQIKTMMLGLNNSKALLTRHNEVQVLQDGAQTFPSMFEALENAREHIHMEFYIFENDKLGNQVKGILQRKAEEGVEVRVIYDDVGSWNLDRTFIHEMRDSGVWISPFMPVRFPRLASKMNYRNHRKILIVDGEVGFIGGMNLGDKYLEGDEKLGYWRDTHLKVRGEVVQSLQAVFLMDWYFVSNEVIQGTAYFKESQVDHECFMQIIPSGPDSDHASIMQSYFATISNALDYIYIINPYFIPNESISTALKTAALSGIDVRLILPGVSDSKITMWSSRSFVEDLLRSGVRVYEYVAGFIHSKTIVADDALTSIGSANLDVRSFEQNFEANALIYNEDLAKQMKNDFLNDLESCKELSYREYVRRPNSRKVMESLARLFAPLL